MVQRWGQPDKAAAINCLASASGSWEAGAQALVAAARLSGTVEVVSSLTGQLLGSCPAASTSGRPPTGSNVSALAFLHASTGVARGLVVASKDGGVRLHACPPQLPGSAAAGEGAEPPGSTPEAAAAWPITSSFQAGSSILAMVG